jgi:hypothetical protein
VPMNRATTNRTLGSSATCLHNHTVLHCGQGRGVAQSGSVLAWGARGRGFKSRRPDHNQIPQL